MNVKELRLRQVDAVLEEAASHPIPPRPLSGWLRAIREALGMSSAVLAQRLDISASGLRKLEQAEAADAITLATLRRVAAALDCELQYVLVPRQSLRQMRWQQAIGRARDWQQRASRTMALEAQQSEASSLIQQEQLDEMAQELLRSGGARLWD